MDLYSLGIFLNLAKTLHFGRASRACNVSPSTLSRLIRRLEDELGQPLFIRDKRSVALSPAGMRFRDYAQDMVDRYESVKNAINRGRTVLAGEIGIYGSVTACYRLLSPLLDEFRRLYPEVHPQVRTGDAADAIRMVLDGETDITIAAKPDQLPSGLAFKAITTTPLLFIGPATRCQVAATLDEPRPAWDRIPMIMARRGLARRRTDRWFRLQGLQPKIYAEVAGNEAIIAMVHLGCGAGVVPRLVLDTSPVRGGIRVLDVRPKLEPYIVGICVKTKRLAGPQVKAFWDLVPDEEPA